MYNKYCKRCGNYSNGYPLCKNCYYEQKVNENEYEGIHYSSGNNVVGNIATIIGGIATIVQCFTSNKNTSQEEPQKQYIIEPPKKIHQNENRQNNENNYQNTNQQTTYKQGSWKTSKGFYVKSQQERTISDFLTENGIFHIYEKKFYIGEGKYLHPDFYIKGPVMFNGKILNEVYIEHWGRENDECYKEYCKTCDDCLLSAYLATHLTCRNSCYT